MQASDIYGKIGVKKQTTTDSTKPSRSESEKKEVNTQVKGNSPASYTMIAILAFVGILVGAKFALEK
jgi:hypothetical protein